MKFAIIIFFSTNKMENNLNQVQTNGSQNSYPIYLLIVAGQTFSKEEKQIVLDRIHTGIIII